MKYFKSIRGYYYKEYKNGKKVRISRKVYEKKLKTLKGGAPTYKNIFSIFIQNSRIFKNIQEMINKSCPFLSLTYVTTEDKNKIGKICLNDLRENNSPITFFSNKKCIAYITLAEDSIFSLEKLALDELADLGSEDLVSEDLVSEDLQEQENDEETTMMNNKISKESIEISSDTEPHYGGRRYNKLLRAIMLLVIYELKELLESYSDDEECCNLETLSHDSIKICSNKLPGIIKTYLNRLYIQSIKNIRKPPNRNISLIDKINEIRKVFKENIQDIFCPFEEFTPPKYMYSLAINPISAWLMMGNFNYDKDVFKFNNEKFIKFQEKNPDLSLKKQIFKYMPLGNTEESYYSGAGLLIHVIIDKKNTKRANDLILKLLNQINKQTSIKCPEEYKQVENQSNENNNKENTGCGNSCVISGGKKVKKKNHRKPVGPIKR